MRFLRIILYLVLGMALNLPVLAASQNANKITRAEVTICKSVKHCVDLTQRHGPDAFDYALLHGEFLRFGHQGQSALLKIMAQTGKDDTRLKRAQNILARGGLNLSAAEQNLIARTWPRGDVRAHAKIMRANLTPIIIDRLIGTLSHEEKNIRAMSRDLIAETTNPLNEAHIKAISKAVITEPSPKLIALLSKAARPETITPLFTPILRSGDAPSVIAAYEALFIANPKTAFQSLLGTLYDLKPDEAEPAFALAALLRHRHKTRADGFYLNFAKDIAGDPKMSALGRVAGFDAVMRQPNNASALLADTPIMIDNLELALGALKSLPQAYVRNYPLHAKSRHSDWTEVIWSKLKSDPYKNPYLAEDFFSSLGQISTPKVRSIVSDALNDQRDFDMIKLGLKTAVAQKDKTRLEQFQTLRQHPITDIQAYADLAISALQNDTPIVADDITRKTIARLNQASNLCRSAPINFKADVKQLPFFDLENVAVQIKPYRTHVSTVMPTRQGWLVGYAAGEWGGDLQYYDNKTGTALPIMYLSGWSEETHQLHQNVKAILPVTPQMPGQYSSEFWAFMTDGGYTNHAAIYRLSQSEENFTLTRHAQLPSRRINLSQETNGDIFISFYDDTDKTYSAHPPLILSKNGSLRRACNTVTSDPLKALP